VSEYLGAFLLGSAAILGNACMLPLYPGLIAFLAGTMQQGRVRQGGMLLGAAVLAGVLGTMLALGAVMFALGQSFSRILPWLLPLTYAIVIALGIALLLGKNPFARVAVAQSPSLINPYASAVVYGGLLAPMTLPCTGPVIVSVFVLGVGSAAALTESLLYFLAFGLGFGWPLVMLPLVALPVQRGITRWLSGNAQVLGRLAGAAMLAIAIFGIWVDVLPNFGNL
jgi:cytochrome c-type biogenesis protein